MDLDFKLVASDHDFIRQLALRNQEHSHQPITLAEAKQMDAISPPELKTERYLALNGNGDCVGRAMISEELTPERGNYMLDVLFAPEEWSVERYKAGLDFLITRACEWDAKVLVAPTKSYREAAIQELLDRGFEVGMKNPMSFLDLARFEAGRFGSVLTRVAQEGYELITFQQYADLVGDGWTEHTWKLDNELFKDVPLVVDFEPWPLEAYTRYMEAEHTDLRTRFLAIRDGELAGMSELHISKADPTIAATHLTGVRREHRRKGVATALKVTAIQRAKELGVLTINTDNEENNPMFQLNLMLGFARRWDWVFLKKRLC